MPVVRAAVPDDLGRVAEIYSPYVTGGVATFEEVPPTVADWKDKLADLGERGLPFLVAEVGGEVAGYALANPYRPKPAYRHTVEDSIYLAPDRTGRGLGRALLGALIEASARAGARQMIAVIADAGDGASAASAALHRAHGFATAGRLVGVGRKHGLWVDTVLMQREL